MLSDSQLNKKCDFKYYIVRLRSNKLFFCNSFAFSLMEMWILWGLTFEGVEIFFCPRQMPWLHLWPLKAFYQHRRFKENESMKSTKVMFEI